MDDAKEIAAQGGATRAKKRVWRLHGAKFSSGASNRAWSFSALQPSARFTPIGWRMSRGRLVLTARKGTLQTSICNRCNGFPSPRLKCDRYWVPALATSTPDGMFERP